MNINLSRNSSEENLLSYLHEDPYMDLNWKVQFDIVALKENAINKIKNLDKKINNIKTLFLNNEITDLRKLEKLIIKRDNYLKQCNLLDLIINT